MHNYQFLQVNTHDVPTLVLDWALVLKAPLPKSCMTWPCDSSNLERYDEYVKTFVIYTLCFSP